MITLKPSPWPRTVRPELLLLQGVVSGGQVGVDQAGLRVAVRLGLQTGGYAPKGFRTLDGPDPSLADFGLVEDVSPDYPHRTALNVFHSDATVRIASDFLSPGERCTLKAITKYKKPRFDVEVLHPFLDDAFAFRTIVCDGVHIDEAAWKLPSPELFRRFLIRHRVKTLNVAGNREKNVGEAAYHFLLEALERKDHVAHLP